MDNQLSPMKTMINSQLCPTLVSALRGREESKIRLLKRFIWRLKRHINYEIRSFNRILRLLVDLKLSNLFKWNIKVKRFFSAVRLIKPFPHANKLPHLMESIKDAEKTDVSILPNDDDDDEEELNTCKFNRFLPLTCQIRDLIKKNPGMAIVNLDDELTGSYHVKHEANS